ncbi:MAG: exosortase-associated EpsI family protein [Chthoniobacterales bacterium]
MSATFTAKSPAATAKKAAAMLAVFLVLLALTAAACFMFQPAASVTEAGVVMHWPDRALGFSGKDEQPGEAEKKLLPPDTEFAKKSYTNTDGDYIGAQIVLSGVEHRSIHRPEICLRGQGWDIRGQQIVSVPLKSGKKLDVMVLDISRPARTSSGKTVDLPALYAYFFVSKDVETPRHFDRVAITNLDLLFHNKAHRWAYVIVTAQVLKGLTQHGRDREQTLQLIEDFLRETAPEFLKSEIPATTTKS